MSFLGGDPELNRNTENVVPPSTKVMRSLLVALGGSVLIAGGAGLEGHPFGQAMIGAGLGIFALKLVSTIIDYKNNNNKED